MTVTKRNVVVIGATGSQGGAVVAELLEHPRLYNVRAITRNTTKPKAQKLAAQGVELFCADLESGREALTAAFAGADVIYALTDFWQKQSAAAEIEQGKAIADAAAEITTLQHFIWSALPDPVALSNGQFRNVHHWMGKNIITEYIQTQKPDLWAKTTTVLFPNYFENTLTDPQRYLPVKDANGTYNLRFPHSPHTVLPNVAIGDTGKLVHLVLEAGSTYFTKTIAFWAQALSEADKLAELGSCYNVPTDYHASSSSEFQQLLMTRDGMSEDIALDFTEQLLIFEKCGNVYAREEFVQAKDIPGLKLQTWSEFIRQHKLL
ncbi:nmrA-like family protein [Aspergillus piperis CBS 112811]|uniref:NmrA-like family protein n=1 Tax=Aspergillus piperis CBS 112811 TaxID=1448313 RepID=A0A8G1VH67_9EURO|nr:nmrA-like family protein [Aspergillus piperis CBS 112811]RAH52310.1 nmrA-like family protein [Aspergillus piperis CBS 112811]